MTAGANIAGDRGVLIDVTNDRVVTDGLSTSHSPRVRDGFVWLLNSGTGHFFRVEAKTGHREDIVFCPGFLRGLAMVGHYAVATISLPRSGRFQGLLLEDELLQRKVDPWCGLLVIDTRHSDIVEWAQLSGAFTEMFDVGVTPATRAAVGIAPDSTEMQDAITHEELAGLAG